MANGPIEMEERWMNGLTELSASYSPRVTASDRGRE